MPKVGRYMSELYCWWYAYGYFAAGEGNFPHIGEVIRYYRKLRGLSKDELATSMQYTKRYIEMLESDQNLVMPELIPRRIMLAKALRIPPILLGLSSLALSSTGETIASLNDLLAADITADSRMMAFYEGILALSWEFYYTSSIQRAARSIDLCFDMLNDEVKDTTGVQRDQYDALRCRFYRLSALVARENMEIDKALEHINESVSIALRLRNTELIASSLVGRIRIYFYKQLYTEALQDAELACVYADAGLLRDPLKGKCYQMAGEAQAHLAGENKALQDKSIAYFDKAGRVARK